VRRVGAVLLAAVLVAGCGGSDGGRPSVEDITAALRAKDLGAALGSGDSAGKRAAECTAQVLRDSAMSDQGLRDLIAGKREFSKPDTEAFGRALPEIAACQGTTAR
jgi:hypothetical protein